MRKSCESGTLQSVESSGTLGLVSDRHAAVRTLNPKTLNPRENSGNWNLAPWIVDELHLLVIEVAAGLHVPPHGEGLGLPLHGFGR